MVYSFICKSLHRKKGTLDKYCFKKKKQKLQITNNSNRTKYNFKETKPEGIKKILVITSLVKSNFMKMVMFKTLSLHFFAHLYIFILVIRLLEFKEN